MKAKEEKGFALILALVILVIMTILGISAVNQASRELREILPYTSISALEECATSASVYAGAQLTRVGVSSAYLPPTYISSNPPVILKIETAHYGENTVPISAVNPSDVSATKVSAPLYIVSNTMGPRTGAGGIPYSIVVLCRDEVQGNEQELNMVVSYFSIM